MRPEITSDAAITPAFVRQLTDAQFALFSYIMLLTGNSADSRDILQDTNLTIIKDASHYREGTPFLAWAKTLAHYQVLTYRKKRGRERLVFDDDVFDRLSATLAERPEKSNRRLDALNGCLKKLTSDQQALITAKYFERLSIPQLSERFACSAAAVASLLYRIRKLLAEVVKSKLAKEAL